jgi:hypothetical protein
MFRYFLLSGLLILFVFQSYSQSNLSQPCASDQYNDHMMHADPSFLINQLNAENHINSLKGGSLSTQSTVVTIPVVVHVVYNTSVQNISDARIQSQIDALNEDFRKLNADTVNVPAPFKHLVADSKIEFCLAQRDPAGNPTNGITRTFTNETSFTVDNKIKYTSQGGKDIWDRNQYLNIWVGNLGGSLGGYAQYPGGNAATDGVVVTYTVFGRDPYVGGVYNKGRVTVHEVGHWFNLRHLWGNGTCGDDYVNDTPIHTTANYLCPAFPKMSSCTGGDPNGELFMNHMDYTTDGCKAMFTEGQVTRMRANLLPGGFRYSLLSSMGCQPPTGTPVCNTPTNISATSITTTSAQLSWIGAGANSYNVRIRESGNSVWTTGTSSGAMVNATGLIAATQYDFEVQSVCTGLNSSWSGIYNFTTAGATCSAPTGLTANNITTTSAQLSWGSTGATSYNIQYRVNGTSTWTSTASTGATITISALTASTQYDFQVQSDCGGTLSSWSVVSNFATTVPTCNAPTGLSAGNTTNSSAQLVWISTGASSYNIQYKVNGTSTWTSTTSSGTSITLSLLTGSTQYDFQVQSDCGGTLSSWSAVSNFTTQNDCGSPNIINVDSLSFTSVIINWNNTTATSYELRYRKSGVSNWNSFTTIATSYYLSNLDTGTTYEFQLSSICNGINSNYSAPIIFTTLEPCQNPSSITLINVSQSTISIQWNITNAINYEVRFKPEGTATWFFAIANSHYVSLNGLIPDTPYEVQVKSLCNNINSNYSNIQLFQTDPECNEPQGVSVVQQNHNSVIVSWDNTSALQYEYRYKVSGTGSWSTGIVSINQIELANLIQPTTYDFEVRSICNTIDTSSYSQSFSFNSTISKIEETESFVTSVYPNPVWDILNIDCNDIGTIKVQIFNVLGVRVKEYNFNSHLDPIQISIHDLASGTYVVKIYSERYVRVHKIMKTAAL